MDLESEGSSKKSTLVSFRVQIWKNVNVCMKKLGLKECIQIFKFRVWERPVLVEWTSFYKVSCVNYPTISINTHNVALCNFSSGGGRLLLLSKWSYILWEFTFIEYFKIQRFGGLPFFKGRMILQVWDTYKEKIWEISPI